MSLLWVVLLALICLADAQRCPSSASIAPCTCQDITLLSLVCYQVSTEAELRNIFSNPDYPTNNFDEIDIRYGGFDSLGADLFGNLTANMVRIHLTESLRSLDVNIFRGPMQDRVRVVDVSSNPAYNELDLRILEGLARTDIMYEAMSNNAVNIIPPTKPTNIYSMGIGRNNFGVIRKDMFTNVVNTQYLYIHESNISSIEPGTFGQLQSLKELQMHRNNLGPVLQEGAFELPSSCDGLVLDDNQIQEVMPGALTGFSPSSYISMWSNDLTTFPEESFRPILERLALGSGTLSLAYNRELPCEDCSIVWLFLTPGLIDTLDQYMCDTFTPIGDIDSGALIDACTP